MGQHPQAGGDAQTPTSPPASAETYIALLFQGGESGEVGGVLRSEQAGGRCADRGFETREKLAGSDRLNQLYLKQWDRNLTQLKLIDPLKPNPDACNPGESSPG